MARLVYVDPTELSSNTSITHPYENYSIAIDLTVIIPNRYSCGYGLDDGSERKLKYSFFGGTLTKDNKSGYLTTNFTDISMTNPGDNTQECFGIESMSITYDSRLFPVVNIKFIDVRGATLMSPSEAMYYDKEKGGNSRELYKAFFTMPYPTFLLTFKGFYGKGATFRLTLQKADIDFDSDNGNFNISAAFIGQMYGVYADLPLNFLSIIPYTDEGSTYWSEQVANGRFKFRDVTGNRVQDMLKIPDLRFKLASIASNQEIIEIVKEGEKKQDDINTRIDTLKSLVSECPFSKDEWNKYKSTKFYYKIVSSESDVITVGKEMVDFYKKIEAYEEGEENKKYAEKFKFLSELKKLNNDKISDKAEILAKYSIQLKIKNDKYKVIEYYSLSTQIFGKTKTYKNENNPFIEDGKSFDSIVNNDKKGGMKYDIKEQIKSKSSVYVCFFPKFDGENVFESVKTEEQQLNTQKVKITRQYKEQEVKLLEEVIGFRPSVRNIYELIFAHMETFMHCFYSNTNLIKNEITSSANARKKSYQELSDNDTDTPVAKKTSGSFADLYSFLPPYTAYYYNNGVGENAKMVYPTEIAKNAGELKELDFVNSLIEATQTYVNTTLELMKKSEVEAMSKKEDASVPTSNIISFIPITPYDFIKKDEIVNPYNIVNKYIDKDLKTIKSLVLGIFAQRALSFMAGDNENVGFLTRDKQRLSFGQIEALNMFKAIGDKFHNEQNGGNAWLDFVKEMSTSGSSDEFIKIICSGKDSVWGDEPLFKANGDILFYNYKNLPLGEFEPSEVKKMNISATSGDKFFSSKYTIEKKSDRNFITKKGGEKTFFYFKDRYYCNNIFENIKKLIDSEETQAAYGERSKDDNIALKYSGRITEMYEGTYNLKFSKSAYRNGYAIENNKEVSNDDTIAIINGTKEHGTIFINFPSWVDENKNGTPLYTQKKYTSADNNLKAYLFLGSLPIDNLNDDDGCIYAEAKSGVALKSVLLREGSYYWYEDNYDKINMNPKPGKQQWHASHNTPGDFETIDFNGSSYTTWKYPDQCTNSRRNELKILFETWVKDEFSKNVEQLENKELYTDNSFTKGLKNFQSSATKYGKLSDDLQKFLKSLFFDVYTIFDTADSIMFSNDSAGEHTIGCANDKMETVFERFITELNIIYEKPISDTIEHGTEYVAQKTSALQRVPKFDTPDIKLSIYMTLKSLYEKWLCSPHNGPKNTWTLDPTIEKSDFNRFAYIDSYHRDIGDAFSVNLSDVDGWLSSCLPTIEGTDVLHANRSVYEFLSIVAEKSGAMLLAVPQKMGNYDKSKINELFTPMPLSSSWIDTGENFVFMYTYKASEHLGGPEMAQRDLNGWSGKGDGFDIPNDTETIEKVFGGTGLIVPGFGVTYAKQNQSIFKNIRLNTSNAGVTDVSIASTMNIASQASTSPRETVLYGQDIYHINANKSYRCEAECMGNAQIMPLMYFQLNNIPFWKGAYIITRVTHMITPGNAVTKFEGHRVNRYAIPMAESHVLIANIVEDETTTTSSTGGSTYAGTYTGAEVAHDVVLPENFKYLRKGAYLNVCDTSGTNGGPTNYQNHGNIQLYDCDGGQACNLNVGISDSKITETNPLIYVHPAHFEGHKDKGREFLWSKVIVDGIVSQLKAKNYNVYKGRANNKSYYGKEAYSFVGKYGSKRVIALVPHWNAGPSTYWCAIMNGSKQSTRLDSVRLMECLAESALEIKKAYGKTINPSGMMNGSCTVMLFPDRKNEKTGVTTYVSNDPGTMPNCACALTENWFCDYSNYKGREWLESEVGKKAIIDLNVNGIIKYINSLKNKKEVKKQKVSTSNQTTSINYSINYDEKIKEMDAYKNGTLVNLTEKASEIGIKVDLRYATKNNITDTNLYGNNLKNIYVRKEIYNALKSAQQYLTKQNKNYQIIVYDGSRPDSIQYYCKNKISDASIRAMFGGARGTYDDSGKRLSDGGATKGSVHTYCAAVDVSIWDKKNNKKVPMGGLNKNKDYDFDEKEGPTQKAYDVSEWLTGNASTTKAKAYLESLKTKGNLTSQEANNRALLFEAMAAGGLYPINNEWWHFQLYNTKTSRNKFKDTCLLF